MNFNDPREVRLRALELTAGMLAIDERGAALPMTAMQRVAEATVIELFLLADVSYIAMNRNPVRLPQNYSGTEWGIR